MRKRLLSLIIALAMMVGVLTPLLSSAADEKAETIILHKLMMDKATLDAWDFNQTEKDGYNDTQNLDQLKALSSLVGKDIKETPNVYFALKFAADYRDATKVDKYVEADAVDELKPAKPLETTDNIDEAVGGLTIPDGVVSETSALKGSLETDEIHEKSTYKGENGETFTDMKAILVKITLPLVNDKGVVPSAHAYPKNTGEKPDTHKDFTKEFTKEHLNSRIDEQKNEAATEPHSAGDVVDYTVTTKIPVETKWRIASWDDKTIEDLTFIQRKGAIAENRLEGKGITVKYDGKKTDATRYELGRTENGFTLESAETDLAEIVKATEDKVIRLDYHAKVNERAIVDILESNDVPFHYGNHKDHGITPIPNKLNNNGELTVIKNWDTGVVKKNIESALCNAQTGKVVEVKDVEAAEGHESKNPVATAAGDTTSRTWKDLNKNIEHKVEEEYSGYSVEYKKGDAGQITVENYNDENPKSTSPTEPRVVTYGAKFVKTDAEGKRLPRVEFVIRNADKKFLTGVDVDRIVCETAQKAYENAIKVYNVLEANEQTREEGAKTAKLEEARGDAWDVTLQDTTQWNGTMKDDKNNIKLTSNELGQFEIVGFVPGKYILVEVKSPKGYALPANVEFEFETKADGTLAVMNIDSGIEDDGKINNALQVINKKIIIPQTGGIGTIIFVTIGLAIMASATIVIKKRQATEAR